MTRRNLVLLALPVVAVPASLYLVRAQSAPSAPVQVLAAAQARPQLRSARSASQVLAGSAKAYQNLRSLSLLARVNGVGGQPGRVVSGIQIAWKKPGRLRVESRAAGETRRVFLSPQVAISTGTLNGKTRFVRAKPETGSLRRAIEDGLVSADPAAIGLAPMLASQKPFGAFRAHLKKLGMRAPTAGEKREIAGAFDIVVGTVQPPGASAATVEYFIARSDKLLRRVNLRIAPENEGATPLEISSTFSNVRVNAPLVDAIFRYTPRRTDRRVASLDPNYDDRLVDGARPFDIQARDLNNKPVSLSSYQGKVWLLDFWATWCPPCLAAEPSITRTYKKYRRRGFDVLGVSLDNSPASLRAFTAQRGIAWRQVFLARGWDDPLVKKYGITGIPASFLIGRDGKIIAVNPEHDKLEAMVKKAL